MNPAAPFLDDLRIASPCKASWDEMSGDQQVRFCGTCQKNVYDVREMTRAEAEQLIASKGEACVRMARRADGTVVTSDCPVGARSKTRRQRAVALVGGGLLAASALLWKVRAEAAPHHRLRHLINDIELAVGKTPAKPEPEPEPEPVMMMGEVAMPEPKVAPVQPPTVTSTTSQVAPLPKAPVPAPSAR